MATQETTIGLDTSYPVNLDGIFKIIHTTLGLVTFICACVWGTWYGGGWVQFVSIMAFLLFGILFVLKLFRIIYKLPDAVPLMLIEMIIVAVFTLFYFISGIVAAVKGHAKPAIGAAAFFSFAAMLALGADLFVKLREFRNEGGSFSNINPKAASSTTTTTNTTVTTPPANDPGQPPAGQY